MISVSILLLAVSSIVALAADEFAGEYSLLAIRVTTPSSEPRETVAQITSTLTDQVIPQFRAVSHDKLRYTLQDVVTLELDVPLDSYADALLKESARTKLNVEKLSEVADRILFCLPDGSLPDGIGGLADFPGHVSVEFLNHWSL